MIGLKIAATGVILSLMVVLLAGSTGNEAPDLVKQIGGLVFTIGCLAVFVGLILSVWL